MTTITIDGDLPAGQYQLTPLGATPPFPPIPPIPDPIPPTANQRTWPLTWGVPASTVIDMVAGDQIAFSFTVPAAAVIGEIYQLNVSEYQGLAYSRQMTLSLLPWDFKTFITWSNGTSVAIACVVGSNVMAGQTLYLNLRDWAVDLNEQGVADGTPTPIIANWQPR